MATALQRQLAAIAATSSNELDLKAQKTSHSKSLLFDQRTAATQSFDLLWQICSEGFHDLCALDSRFLRYNKSIFNPQSRTEDRALMTSQENKELDSVLDSFLALVGSRLLITPALKAVEWLVRRFSIHERNTSSVILTFLPYYDNDIFLALLSILPNQLPPAFKFLHSYVHNLSSPPLAILTYTASHNPGFFSSLNNYVVSAAKSRCHHTMLLTMWASICGQTVNEKLSSSKSGRQNVQNTREDSFLTEFLPIISQALAIRKAPELSLASYMITVILVTKADLSGPVLDAFLEAVALSWNNETYVAGLACAAVIFERKHTRHVPKRAAREAFKFSDLGVRLASLAEHQNVQPLAQGLLQAIVQRSEGVDSLELAAFAKPLLLDDILDNDTRQSVRVSLEEAGVHLEEITSSRQAIAGIERSENGLSSARTREDSSDVDVEQSTESLDLDSLPANVPEPSFLNLAASSTFEPLSLAFARIESNPDLDYAAFYGLPVWQRNEHQDPLLLTTFLARVWSSATKATVRAEALSQFAASLESLPLYSFEEFLPYLLVGLSDPALAVRKAASRLALDLIEHHRAQKKNNGNEMLYVYGPGKVGTASLSHKVYSHFLQRCLKHELEECQADASHCRFVFSQAMDQKADSQNASEGSSKGLRTAQKQELFNFLAHHIELTPSLTAKLRLLGLCTSIRKISGQPRSALMMDSLKSWASSADAYHDASRNERMPLATIDTAHMNIVHPAHEAAMEFLLLIAKDSSPSIRSSLRSAAFARLQTIWLEVTQKRRGEYAKELLDLALTKLPEAEGIAIEASSILRNVGFTPEVLVNLINYACESLESSMPGSTKKRRINSGKSVANTEHENEVAMNGVAKLSLVLELVDGTSLAGQVRVYHALFQALRIIQEFRQRTAHDVDFVLLLTLSNLLSITKSFADFSSPPQLDTSFVRSELIVEAVRHTENAQIRNNGVLLLSALTKYLPNAVLHSVVPVFTLVSSTTARQSDELSVHVVDQVIREIIPLLVEPIRHKTVDFVGAMSELLSSFAAAFLHIPLTRRLKMFTLLASSLGPKESLCPIIATLIDQHRANGSVAIFCAQLIQQFEIGDALQSIVDYLKLAMSCVSDELSPFAPMMKKLESTEDHEETARGLLIAGPVLVRDGITPQRVQNEIHDAEKAGIIQDKFGELLIVENKLTLADMVGRKPQLRNSASKTLESTLKLLPFGDFIKSIERLLDPAEESISRSVLKSFEGQLRADTPFDRSARIAALEFLPKLTALLKSPEESRLKLNAIVCADLICEKFGKLDSAATLAAARVVSSDACVDGNNTLLRTLSLHCLSSIVEVLGDEFIPLLTSAFGSATRALSDSLSETSPDVRLHNAALALVISIVDQLAHLVPSATIQQLVMLVSASATSSVASQTKTTREHFTQAVASQVEVFTVFEAIHGAWMATISKGPKALRQLTDILAGSIAAAPKSKISKRPRVLLNAFTTLLRFRSDVVSDQLTGIYTSEQLEALESTVIESLMSLVLKVNDAAFHPFFRSLVDWAEHAPQVTASGRVLRWTAIFELLASLSDRLKSLVTSYFNDVFEHMITILNTSAEALAFGNVPSAAHGQKQKHKLATSALTALTSSLRHDASDFYAAPARFDELHPALLSLLPACNPTPPNSATQTHTLPALVALAASLSGNAAHLVALQTSILDRLLKYNVKRSGSPQEVARGRLAGVMAMRAIGHELGEEWLAELPRMLPVVSELMEDDDERVEHETSGWVQEMEGVLGENVGDMLT